MSDAAISLFPSPMEPSPVVAQSPRDYVRRHRGLIDVNAKRVDDVIAVAGSVFETPLSLRVLADTIHRIDGLHRPHEPMLGVILKSRGWKRSLRRAPTPCGREWVWYPPDVRAPGRGRPRKRRVVRFGR